MPSRVLDLQADNQIRLVESNGLKHEYVALSHCWGTGPRFNTTKQSLSNRYTHICLADMPRTFQDAVTVCQQLQIQYLWIDSLCIIQDDDSDWLREAAAMGKTYKNAFITIVASRAGSDQEGFLQPREGNTEAVLDMVDMAGQSCNITLTPWKTNLHWTAEGVRAVRQPIAKDHPLTKRAWAMQERYLSRRKLLYCTEQIYWECQEITSSEDGIKSTALEFQVDRLWTPDDGFRLWYDMIAGYSACGLTFESDVFHALYSVAHTVAQASGRTFYAGLWIEDLACSLAWQVRPTLKLYHYTSGVMDFGKDDSKDCRKTIQYQAPSFSWASRRGGVDYVCSLGRSTDAPITVRKILFDYIAHNTETNTESFNRKQPAQGWLRLRAQLIPAEKGSGWVDCSEMLLILSPLGRLQLHCSFDDTDIANSNLHLLILPLSKSRQYLDWYLTYLIVRKTDETEADELKYVRIGAGHSQISLCCELRDGRPYLQDTNFHYGNLKLSPSGMSRCGILIDAVLSREMHDILLV